MAKRKKVRMYQVIEQDLSLQESVDITAKFVMEIVEQKVSPELATLLNQMLLGFNPDMQLELADDLLDFVHGGVIHTTGCPSADAVLEACFRWIAEEKGQDSKVINLLFNQLI